MPLKRYHVDFLGLKIKKFSSNPQISTPEHAPPSDQVKGFKSGIQFVLRIHAGLQEEWLALPLHVRRNVRGRHGDEIIYAVALLESNPQQLKPTPSTNGHHEALPVNQAFYKTLFEVQRDMAVPDIESRLPDYVARIHNRIEDLKTFILQASSMVDRIGESAPENARMPIEVIVADFNAVGKEIRRGASVDAAVHNVNASSNASRSASSMKGAAMTTYYPCNFLKAEWLSE